MGKRIAVWNNKGVVQKLTRALWNDRRSRSSRGILRTLFSVTLPHLGTNEVLDLWELSVPTLVHLCLFTNTKLFSGRKIWVWVWPSKQRHFVPRKMAMRNPNPTKPESHLAPDSANSLLFQSTFVLGIDGRKYKLQRLVETWEMPEVKARNFY